ncbi:two-component system sensor histidine kinase NtrB [Alicyclobacillus fastidiosus]|uniref:two-component system sensor histidine kinase NtrB n=1 Tax=Alicyclobacillus fastidiosus TaxID=392011 RepID=UPI0024E179A5|nr:ATP-binding protein [Alicyclobacillus fastidiosus]
MVVSISRLFLDANDVILDVIGPTNALSADLAQRLPGMGLHAMHDGAGGHLYPPGEAQPLRLAELGGDWRSAIAELSEPMALAKCKVVLSIPSSLTWVQLQSSLVTSVYALQQVCSLSTAPLEHHGGGSVRPAVEKGEKIESKLTEFEKNRSLASLSAGIAHEIRNPLTTARGFLQLFEQRCEPADKKFVELTIRELDRIHALLQDFMGLARPDDESTQLVDIRELTHSVYQFLRPEATLCGVLLNYDVPSSCVLMSVQADRIKQVLINLLQNAVHACDKDGEVHVTLRDFSDHATITIRDNGCGISDMHQLFRPFQTTKSNGTGLGMFVSKHIIEAHRGHLQVDSTVGEGTTVTVYLPRG